MVSPPSSPDFIARARQQLVKDKHAPRESQSSVGVSFSIDGRDYMIVTEREIDPESAKLRVLTEPDVVWENVLDNTMCAEYFSKLFASRGIKTVD